MAACCGLLPPPPDGNVNVGVDVGIHPRCAGVVLRRRDPRQVRWLGSKGIRDQHNHPTQMRRQPPTVNPSSALGRPYARATAGSAIKPRAGLAAARYPSTAGIMPSTLA